MSDSNVLFNSLVILDIRDWELYGQVFKASLSSFNDRNNLFEVCSSSLSTGCSAFPYIATFRAVFLIFEISSFSSFNVRSSAKYLSYAVKSFRSLQIAVTQPQINTMLGARPAERRTGPRRAAGAPGGGPPRRGIGRLGPTDTVHLHKGVIFTKIPGDVLFQY